jgi:hypothetical protein
MLPFLKSHVPFGNPLLNLTLWQSPPEGSEHVLEVDSWELAQEVSVTKVATCGAWMGVCMPIAYLGLDGVWFLE